MTDREKVIKALECCISGNPAICKRRGCPYADEHEGVGDTCIDHVMADALALLKAQEPVEPTKQDEDNTKYCGVCGSAVGYEVIEPSGLGYVRYNYCPDCGRAVKWE